MDRERGKDVIYQIWNRQIGLTQDGKPDIEVNTMVNPLTWDFLMDCVREEIIYRKLKPAEEISWHNHISQTFAYFFTDASMDEIGSEDFQQYHRKPKVSRQSVSKTIERTLYTLWEIAGTELQEKHQEFGKMLHDNDRYHDLIEKNLHLVRRQESLHRATVLAERILRLQQEGMASRDILREIGDMSPQQYRDLRRTMRTQGIRLPVLYNRGVHDRLDLIKDITQATSDEMMQHALNQVSYTFLVRSRGEENPVIMSLSKVVDGRFFCGTRDISTVYEALRANPETAVPVGVIEMPQKDGGYMRRFYFIATKDKERALEVLDKSETMDVFRESRVISVAGPETESLVTSTALQRGVDYKPIRQILRDNGLSTDQWAGGLTIEDILDDDCPVPVFGYNNGLYCAAGDIAKFTQYIHKRSKKILYNSPEDEE